MEALFRYISSAIVALASLFTPIVPLVWGVAVFIGIDFVSGVLADRRITIDAGRKWYFASGEAWRTVRKAGFAIMAIAMAWIIESCILDFCTLNLTKMFAGFVCGVELWSFLENASVLSDAALFGWLRRYVHHKLKRELGNDFDNTTRTEK